MDDPRPTLTRALDQIGGLTAAVRPDALDRPTPCETWTVRDLLGHLVTVHRRIVLVTGGEDSSHLPTVSDLPDGVTDAVPDGVTDALTAERTRIDALWADDSVLDRMLTAPFGTLPGRALGWAYTQELTTHAWDLASALERATDLDPAIAEAVEPLARQFVPAEPRGGYVPFGPPVAIGEDADPYRRLVAWLGRTP